MSRYGVREIPKSLKLLTDVAKYHFLRKPGTAISEMKSGIPEVHRQFWNKLSIGELYTVYKAVQATPAKVLDDV